jgi:hypothetical protein
MKNADVMPAEIIPGLISGIFSIPGRYWETGWGRSIISISIRIL